MYSVQQEYKLKYPHETGNHTITSILRITRRLTLNTFLLTFASLAAPSHSVGKHPPQGRWSTLAAENLRRMSSEKDASKERPSLQPSTSPAFGI